MDPGLIWYPAYTMKKESQSVVPNFNLALAFPVPKSLEWAYPTLSYIPQHKYTIIILHQWKSSQMNICLKADVIMHWSEQVDEALSLLILALP